MGGDWDDVSLAPMPGPWPEDGDVLVLGYDGRDGGEPYACEGYYRQSSVSGCGYVSVDGGWLRPQPTHFKFPLDSPDLDVVEVLASLSVASTACPAEWRTDHPVWQAGYDDGFNERRPPTLHRLYVSGWLTGYCGAYQDDGRVAVERFREMYRG